jgi:ketosteroid isomerase-like protein
MSEANVETARRALEAVERSFDALRRDPRSLAAAMEVGDLPPESREAFSYLDPEFEWNSAFAGVSFRGHLECARGIDWLLEAAEHYSVSLLEITDLGGDRVLAVLDRDLKGKETGIEMRAPLFSVLTLRRGLIVRNDEYSDRAAALEAAGLRD